MGDFNGSGYSSLAFGFVEYVADNSVPGGINHKCSEMTVCLSTGRAMDCGVRKKYSGTQYLAPLAVGNFYGDGSPAILAEQISYAAGAAPKRTGNIGPVRNSVCGARIRS